MQRVHNQLWLIGAYALWRSAGGYEVFAPGASVSIYGAGKGRRWELVGRYPRRSDAVACVRSLLVGR